MHFEALMTESSSIFLCNTGGGNSELEKFGYTVCYEGIYLEFVQLLNKVSPNSFTGLRYLVCKFDFAI